MPADDTVLFLLFSSLTALALGAPHAPAALRSLRTLLLAPAVDEAALVAALGEARARIAGLLPLALQEAEAQAGQGLRAGPRAPQQQQAGLARLAARLEGALAAGSDAAAEAALGAALARAQHRPRVAAALQAARRAHPLYAPPALLLAVQAQVLAAEVAVFAEAAAAAAGGGGGGAKGFAAALRRGMAAALGEAPPGRQACYALALSEGSLAPAVAREAGGEALQGRECLWAELLAAAEAAEAQGEAEFEGFGRQLRGMREDARDEKKRLFEELAGSGS